MRETESKEFQPLENLFKILNKPDSVKSKGINSCNEYTQAGDLQTTRETGDLQTEYELPLLVTRETESEEFQPLENLFKILNRPEETEYEEYEEDEDTEYTP